MAGTKEGAQRTRDTNYEKYGPDFYANIGSKGGSTPTKRPKGFAAMSEEKRRAAGAKGGRVGKNDR